MAKWSEFHFDCCPLGWIDSAGAPGASPPISPHGFTVPRGKIEEAAATRCTLMHVTLSLLLVRTRRSRARARARSSPTRAAIGNRAMQSRLKRNPDRRDQVACPGCGVEVRIIWPMNDNPT